MPEHLQSILAAAAHIRWILVTHTHRDHSPLASELARATGARLIGLPPPADGRQDESFRPEQAPLDGERISARRNRTDGDPYAGPRLQLRVLPLGKRAAAVHRRSRARRRLTGHPAARRRYGAVPALSRQARRPTISSALRRVMAASWRTAKKPYRCCALTAWRARRRCCAVSSGALPPAPHRRSRG